MTGVSYRRIQFGPVPDGYDFLYGLLAREGALTIEEVEYGNGNVGEVIKSSMGAEDGVLTEEEVRVVQGVARDFGGYTAVGISEHSHEENAWKDTPDRNLISYEYAFGLR